MFATHPAQLRHRTWLLVMTSMDNLVEQQNKSCELHLVPFEELHFMLSLVQYQRVQQHIGAIR
jgi:hypothetical protein